jgi:hypothetical protein
MPSSCQQCGTNLKLARFGRRRRFCSNACRQVAFRNETTANGGPSYPSKGKEKRVLEPTEIKRDFPLRNEEFEPPGSFGNFSNGPVFEKINGITWKLTDGVQINTGSGRASRALGYVMEVFPGRWMARVRNLGSDLLSFGAAKQEAIRLYRCRDKGTVDWIHELNLRAAVEINRSALASDKRKAPVDLVGGYRQGHIDPKIRTIVLDAEINFLTDARPEAIKGDYYLFEYDSDGYPGLPACLDRRKPRLRQAAYRKKQEAKEQAAKSLRQTKKTVRHRTSEPAPWRETKSTCDANIGTKAQDRAYLRSHPWDGAGG